MDDDSKSNTIITLLSDIQAKLAVNVNDIRHLEDSLTEIKQNTRAIESGYPSRREFTEGLQAVRNEIPSHEEIEELKQFIWKVAGALLVISILLPFILPKLFRNL
jgi:plastocyanin domain-containing protein